MNGEPFLYGSRLTVRQVLELRRNGYTLVDLLKDHPELKPVGIAEAFVHAAADRARYAEFFEADGSLSGPGYTEAEAALLPGPAAGPGRRREGPAHPGLSVRRGRRAPPGGRPARPPRPRRRGPRPRGAGSGSGCGPPPRPEASVVPTAQYLRARQLDRPGHRRRIDRDAVDDVLDVEPGEVVGRPGHLLAAHPHLVAGSRPGASCAGSRSRPSRCTRRGSPAAARSVEGPHCCRRRSMTGGRCSRRRRSGGRRRPGSGSRTWCSPGHGAIAGGPRSRDGTPVAAIPDHGGRISPR